MSAELACAGSILEIDLTRQTCSSRPTPKDWVVEYLGGRGLGVRIMWEVAPGTAASAPENPLIICPGLLNGYPSPGTPRCALVTKSALTRPQRPRFPDSSSINISNIGGFLGAEMKLAGLDALVIRGRSARPTALTIVGREAQFLDAAQLWGLRSTATERALRARLGGDQYKTFYIGPAGERGARTASIIHNATNAFSRGGSGFVMGSKNLKAVAIKGERIPDVGDYGAYRQAVDQLRRDLKAKQTTEQYVITKEFSTLTGFEWLGSRRGLAVRNYQRCTMPEMDDYHHRAKKMWVQESACYGCPIPCRKSALIQAGPYPGAYPEASRFESSTMLGSDCGLTDERVIPALTHACTEVGIDTISTGNLLGFLMDARERNLLPSALASQLGGLSWGDAASMMRLIEKIGMQEDVGELLGQGLRRVSQTLGPAAADFAFHAKGLEYAAWNIKGFPAMAVAYMTSPRGACHLVGNTPRIQNKKAAMDALGVCHFIDMIVGVDIYAPLTAAVLGQPTDSDGQDLVGERIFNLERCFNAREGFEIGDDLSVPRALGEEPLPDGPKKHPALTSEQLHQRLDKYYRQRGWSPQTGLPIGETLDRLSLQFTRS